MFNPLKIKAMKNFEIKITGSGTKNQIEIRLLEIGRQLQIMTVEELAEGLEQEDSILFTEINPEYSSSN